MASSSSRWHVLPSGASSSTRRAIRESPLSIAPPNEVDARAEEPLQLSPGLCLVLDRQALDRDVDVALEILLATRERARGVLGLPPPR